MQQSLYLAGHLKAQPNFASIAHRLISLLGKGALTIEENRRLMLERTLTLHQFRKYKLLAKVIYLPMELFCSDQTKSLPPMSLHKY